MNTISRFPVSNLRWRLLVLDPCRRDVTLQWYLVDEREVFVTWVVRVVMPEIRLSQIVRGLQSLSVPEGYTFLVPAKRGLKIVPYKLGCYYSYLYQKVLLLHDQTGIPLQIHTLAERTSRLLFQELGGL